MIVVCPLSRIGETADRVGAERIITLIAPGTPVVRPTRIAPENHLLLEFHDIWEPRDDLVLPADEHVRQVLDFAEGWDRKAPLIVHCFAGVSRSTAAAYTIAAAIAPRRDEAELARALRRASPTATPNPLIISLADRMLGREGRMSRAVAEIGRGEDTAECVPFVLDI